MLYRTSSNSSIMRQYPASNIENSCSSQRCRNWSYMLSDNRISNILSLIESVLPQLSHASHFMSVLASNIHTPCIQAVFLLHNIHFIKIALTNNNFVCPILHDIYKQFLKLKKKGILYFCIKINVLMISFI